MNEKIINIKNNIIELIVQQKLLAGIAVLILFMSIGILYISLTQRPTAKPTITSQQSISGSILTPPNLQNTNTQASPSNNIQKTLAPNQPATKNDSPSLSKEGSGVITTKLSNTSNPTSTSQPANSYTNGGGANQSQSTSAPSTTTQTNTNTNNSSNSLSNNASSPKIVFIGSDGKAQTYVPPTTPPAQITWARYTNNLEKYSIEYPSNWQIVTTQYRGHEAIFIYAPGANPSDPNVQYISYGWSSYFYPPNASYTGSFAQDGVPGTIYTNGSLGSSFIAGVFQYYNGFLVLNNNISDEVFAYIFNHMILSLNFNTP